MPIDLDSFPLREFRRSRELQWFPAEIDFSKDAEDWKGLSDDEREFLNRQVVGFMLGERVVTHDLAPLQQALRRERGRMEEEMYLTVQLFEESIHLEFFHRWMSAAAPETVGRHIPFPDSSGQSYRALSESMEALTADPSPENQVRSVCIYHMIIEGVLAEVGYQIFYGALEGKKILPGLTAGLKKIQRDESRHIAFGTYLLQRLIAERPALSDIFDEEMAKLRPIAVDSTRQTFEAWGDGIPFNLDAARFHDLSRQLFKSRIDTVRRGALVAS